MNIKKITGSAFGFLILSAGALAQATRNCTVPSEVIPGAGSLPNALKLPGGDYIRTSSNATITQVGNQYNVASNPALPFDGCEPGFELPNRVTVCASNEDGLNVLNVQKNPNGTSTVSVYGAWSDKNGNQLNYVHEGAGLQYAVPAAVSCPGNGTCTIVNATCSDPPPPIRRSYPPPKRSIVSRADSLRGSDSFSR